MLPRQVFSTVLHTIVFQSNSPPKEAYAIKSLLIFILSQISISLTKWGIVSIAHNLCKIAQEKLGLSC